MIRDPLGHVIPAGTFTGVPDVLNLSVSSAVTGPLKVRTLYSIWSSVDAFFLWGGSGVSANTSSHPLKAGVDRLHMTDSSNLYIAAVVPTSTGALYISEYNVYEV